MTPDRFDRVHECSMHALRERLTAEIQVITAWAAVAERETDASLAQLRRAHLQEARRQEAGLMRCLARLAERPNGCSAATSAADERPPDPTR